ncbi:unnamed protein product [Camellia sinensis]
MVLPFLREKHNEFVLRKLIKRLENHKLFVKFLSRYFHYLDRYFIPRMSFPTLTEVGLICFCNLYGRVIPGINYYYSNFKLTRSQGVKGEVRDAVTTLKVQNELLDVYSTQLLEMENSRCRVLLRDDKVEDLSTMYRLCHKIPKALEPFANIFKQHVTAEG